MRFLIFILLLSACDLSAQVDSIPFKLTIYNNIIIHATLNSTDELDLMFHTAVNSISLTEEALQRLKDQRTLQTTKVLSWGGYSQTKFSESNNLKIGDLQWENEKVWISEKSGHFSDGKFGPNLFEGKAIEINFDLSMLVIHDRLPNELEDYSKFDLTMEEGSMYLEGLCYHDGQEHQNKFMIHSGYGGTILLDDEFASRSNMNTLEIIDESELKDSYGRILKKKKAILPKFDLETFDFKDLPMGFFEGKIGNEKKSVLGGEILKRFNIIFDIQNSQIYMKPNSLMELPFKDV